MWKNTDLSSRHQTSHPKFSSWVSITIAKRLPEVSSQWKQQSGTLDCEHTVCYVFCRQSEEHSQREEDFYYTEVYQDMEQTAPPAGPRPSCTSPCSPSRHRPPSPSTPEILHPSPLSQSAPSSSWQVHTEHSYQVRCFTFLWCSVSLEGVLVPSKIWLVSHVAVCMLS